MNEGNTWYCMITACIQPAGSGGCGRSSSCQRVATSHAAHQVMAASTLVAPTRNNSRWGAAARREEMGTVLISACAGTEADLMRCDPIC
jgi:hypothetical protein